MRRHVSKGFRTQMVRSGALSLGACSARQSQVHVGGLLTSCHRWPVWVAGHSEGAIARQPSAPNESVMREVARVCSLRLFLDAQAAAAPQRRACNGSRLRQRTSLALRGVHAYAGSQWRSALMGRVSASRAIGTDRYRWGGGRSDEIPIRSPWRGLDRCLGLGWAPGLWA